MAESRRKSEAKPKHHEVEDTDEPHKRRERIFLVVLLLGAVAIILGMILLAGFLSGGSIEKSEYPLAYGLGGVVVVMAGLILFEWLMRRRSAA